MDHSKITQPYILMDMAYIDKQATEEVLFLPNEVTLLKSKQIAPELKERLGLITSVNPVAVDSEFTSRYRQSLSERYGDAISALDALPDEVPQGEETE